MDIAQIETFLAITNSGSFSEASRQLHITQPAASKRIRALEVELGYRLFKRMSGSAELTEEGKRFVAYANTLLNTWKMACRGLSKVQTENTLTLGATTLNSNYVLPFLLPEFLRLNQSCRFFLKSDHSWKLFELVETGSIDAALINFVPENHCFSVIRLGRYEIIPVVNTRHYEELNTGLKKNKDITVLYFLSERKNKLIFPLSQLQSKGIEPDRFLQCDTAETVKRLLFECQNPTIAFLPRISVQKEIENKLLMELDIESWDHDNQVLLIHAAHNDSPTLENFISFVKSSTTLSVKASQLLT